MFESNYWDPVIETMGPKEQREMQTEKLQRQLRYVLDRSPFYRRKFEEDGFDLMRLRDVADRARRSRIKRSFARARSSIRRSGSTRR